MAWSICVPGHQLCTRNLLQHSAKIVAHLRDPLIAVPRFFLQGFVDDLPQTRWQCIDPHLGERPRCPVEDLMPDVDHGLSLECPDTGEHFIARTPVEKMSERSSARSPFACSGAA